MDSSINKRKTGTTTVGIVTKDAIVLGADKRATAGGYIAMKDVTKIVPINDRMIVTITGVVSDIQQLIKYIRAELKLKDLKTGMPSRIKAVANLMASFNYSGLRSQGSVAGFLLAGSDHEGVHLYDISVDGVVTEIKDYESTGSGSPYAIAVIESQYKPTITEVDAVALAKRAIATAIERDTGSGNGYDIFVVNKGGVQHRETVAIRGALETLKH
jgi:proteasome beta subunit